MSNDAIRRIVGRSRKYGAQLRGKRESRLIKKGRRARRIEHGCNLEEVVAAV
jgi:hypothetical protein